MKSLEVKAARVRLGYRQSHVAEYLGIATPTYCRKENGYAKFTDQERAKLVALFGFDLKQANEYLYDGTLPVGES